MAFRPAARPCILHIGFGKTGTSALQGYLSRHPVVDAPQRHRYVAIHGGRVLHGDEMAEAAAAAPAGYVASIPHLWERDDLEDVVGRLAAAVPADCRPILSQEGWGRRGGACREADGLRRLGLRAQVVAWVRPQIEWFNSAWWQVWAWRGDLESPADLLRQWRDGWRPGFMRWRTMLDAWAANPAVDGVTARLYRRDTIADFFALLGAPPPAPDAAAVVNRSLAPVHIRLLRCAPGLRRQHTPQIDWRLQKLLPSPEPSPWMLTPDDMQRIVDGCRADNERLAALLAPEQAEEMRRDPRWWSPEPYLDRPLAQPADLQATPEDLERAVPALLRALA